MNDGDASDEEGLDGLAGERTDLAWSRSGLAIVACLAAITKQILAKVTTLNASTIVATTLSVGGIAWAFSLVWTRAQAATSSAGHRTADAGRLRSIAIGTAALGIGAAIVALVPAR
ncbi:MAG: DUF202 domain-containing protein [Acidimicrobiia bacterium]